MYFVIKLGSVTNAQRAARLLKSRGYRPALSRIENPTPADGCGYVVKVFAENEQEIVRLLTSHSITVLGVEVR